jgi:hypothetical protein
MVRLPTIAVKSGFAENPHRMGVFAPMGKTEQLRRMSDLEDNTDDCHLAVVKLFGECE